jgi:hypothetical protein
MAAAAQGRAGTRRVGVGYTFREVDSCPACATPHRHVKQRDGTYICYEQTVVCPACGIPSPRAGEGEQQAPCWGCAALRDGRG